MASKINTGVENDLSLRVSGVRNAFLLKALCLWWHKAFCLLDDGLCVKSRLGNSLSHPKSIIKLHNP